MGVLPGASGTLAFFEKGSYKQITEVCRGPAARPRLCANGAKERPHRGPVKRAVSEGAKSNPLFLRLQRADERGMTGSKKVDCLKTLFIFPLAEGEGTGSNRHRKGRVA